MKTYPSDKEMSAEDAAQLDIEDLHCRLISTQKMLDSKEEILKAQEESLRQSRAQVMELTRCLDALQMDRDTKVLEVVNLQRAIEMHTNTINELQRERFECFSEARTGSTSGEYNIFHQMDIQKEMYELEIEKQKNLNESLYFDLDIMECLYKNCYEEMVKQEQTINLLRQAYFDHDLERFNLKLENSLLESRIHENATKKQYQNLSHQRHKCMDKLEFDVHDDIKYLKNQLQVLHDVLVSETTKSKFGSENGEALLRYTFSQIEKLIEHTNSPILTEGDIASFKKTIQRYQKKLKITKGHLRKSKMKIVSLKKRSTMSSDVLLNTKDAFFELESSKERVSRLKEDICTLKRNLRESEDHRIELLSQLILMQKEKEYFKHHTECNKKIRDEMREVSAMGEKLCSESFDVFKNLKHWITYMKKG